MGMNTVKSETTVLIPRGYHDAHPEAVAALRQQFPSIEVIIDGVYKIEVSALHISDETRAVRAWIDLMMPKP